MAYTPNVWQDRTGIGLNKFTDQNGNEYTFTPAPDSISQAGTPFSAEWMNHIEQGIKDNSDNIADIDDKFPVSIANGGTGATTAEQALNKLGVPWNLSWEWVAGDFMALIEPFCTSGTYQFRTFQISGSATNKGELVAYGLVFLLSNGVDRHWLAEMADGGILINGFNSLNTYSASGWQWRRTLTNVLRSTDYGSSLPAAGTPGRIFFKKA